MAEETATVAGLSLPPKVVGKVNGHLVMKVDEVLWARKPPGEVSAVVLWWGGEEPTQFRPSDVTEDSVKRRNAGVIYEIRTSLDLFEKYLRKCGGLDIAIADKYGMPIGCVTIEDIWRMITNSPFQGYYPIVNNFGNRIGDLHVSFNLRMQSSIESGNLTVLKAPNKQGFKSKDLKRKDSQSVCYGKSKEEKTKKNQRVLNDEKFIKRVTPDSSSQCDSTTGNSDDDLIDVEKKESSKNRVSPTSNIISQILQHGTRIRNAMTASLMNDELQLDLKNMQDFSTLSSLDKAAKHLTQDPNCCLPPPVDENTCHVSTLKSCSNTVPNSNKRVIDYLSGKPMTDHEEKEALAAIRNMTPTKDMLENVPDIPENSENVSQSFDFQGKESSEVVTNITDYCANSHLVGDNQSSFEIDAQILSHVNCLRITVLNLVLNSVGIKRIGSYPKKKSGPSQSNISLQPPGVTYFVEYKFPLVTGSRQWESDVRYCSKRFSDHEVTFGDRTVHNLPASWQNSGSEEHNWSSLVSSLSFKVCARHLHQRVPLVLGLASPDSAKPLIKSAHLRHNFDLPVIDSNRLPVAQLRVCLELGRDRIHFGGLLDPENNSLGMKSPRVSSTNKSQHPLTKKITGKNVTTVTRNISAKSYTTPKLPLHQATQADHLIRKLVNNANVTLKSSQSSGASSLPSTNRSYFKQINPHAPLQNIQISSYMTRRSPNRSTQPNDQFLKHELAFTFHQVIGTDILTKLRSGDQFFYISYKFPVLNTLKTNAIDWHSCSTELSQCVDGTWIQIQNNIHAVVIPKRELFYNFLKQTYLKHEGKSGMACITFSLCVRCNEEKVQDFLVAEAYLPLSCLSTLEEAYKDAARNKSNFSSSSCSSIVLDLPFESLSTKLDQVNSEKNGCLRLKVDYRHSVVEPSLYKSYPPGSRGDSVSETIPYLNIEDFSNTKGTSFTKFRKPSEGDLNLGNTPLSVPSWARTPDKKALYLPDDGFQFEEAPNLHCRSKFPLKNVHAMWEHTSYGKTQESALKLESFPNRSNAQRSVLDVISGTEKCKSVSEPTGSKISKFLRTESIDSEDRQLHTDDLKEHGIDTLQTAKSLLAKSNAETNTSPRLNQRHMSTRGTSPIPLLSPTEDKVTCGAASIEAKPDQQDKSQQVLIKTVNEESQTSPREKSIQEETLAESKIEMPVNLDKHVLSCSSIDEVETIEVDSKCVLTVNSTPRDSGNQETLKCEPKHITSLSSQSSVDSNIVARTFKARVGVECALHLHSTTGPLTGMHQNTKSFVFVSLNPCGVDGSVSTSMCQNPLSVSPSVINNGEPEWHWEKEVVLPCDLLVMTMKRLIFKIWEINSSFSEPMDVESAELIGFSTVDLSVLSAGLPFICGWYNIIDFSGTCRGQIKLSVEPLEKISEIVDFLVVASDDSPQSNSAHSMFLAHCAYPEFPSHITQFPDIHVQRIDSKAPNQILTTNLGTYELVIKQKEEVEHPCDASEFGQYSQKMETSAAVPLHRKAENTHLAQQAGRKYYSKPSTTLTVTSSTDSGAAQSNSGVEVDKDPSKLLREKLSELDKITRNMKARLQAETTHSNLDLRSHHMDREDHASGDCSDDQAQANVNKDNGASCDNCACCSVKKNTQSGNEECHTDANNSREHHKNVEAHGAYSTLFKHEKNIASQKQRKMWKRQEDLIDFGNLCIDSEDEEDSVSQNEDEGEWLTEAALQHVFNPYLFNDMLNSMNASRGVTVIELDDTGTSEDSPATTSRENDFDDKVPKESNLPQTIQHKNKRGDETFRKEASEMQRNKIHTNRQTNRSGLSAGDADSGVDVDLSSNFQSRLFFPASSAHHESFLPNRADNRAETEREESSSCSSRYQQSTITSSASATPFDSPLHTIHSVVDPKGSSLPVISSVDPSKRHGPSRRS